MQLLGWTRNATPDRAQHGLRLLSLDELFAAADVVTLHLSLSNQTERLISRTLIGKMKRSAYNAKEAGENMLRIAYATLEAFLKGKTLDVVNAV